MANPFKPFLKNISFLLNKYFIVAFVFVVWITFFDRYDLLSGSKLNKEIVALETEKNKLKENIKKVDAQMVNILRNKEEYAKKNLFLKKDNEVVYVIDEEKKSN